MKSPFVFSKKTESDKVSVFSKGDIIVSLRSDFKALKMFLTLWESATRPGTALLPVLSVEIVPSPTLVTVSVGVVLSSTAVSVKITAPATEVCLLSMTTVATPLSDAETRQRVISLTAKLLTLLLLNLVDIHELSLVDTTIVCSCSANDVIINLNTAAMLRNTFGRSFG